MRELSELMTDDEIKRCSCGSAAFFDWGIELLSSTEKYAHPRYEGYAGREHVKICAECHKPVLLFAGELFDASEYVDREQIERLIAWTRSKRSAVPAAIMDP